METIAVRKTDWILPIILINYFMILLDNSIVFTGSVRIAADLNLNAIQLTWVSNAYALTFGGLLLFGGRAGDIFGRRRVFILGMVIFAIGSLFVGTATSATHIIVARFFQGVGSAILAPSTLALILDNYKDKSRVKAIALYGATAGVGASIGLVLGGFFASVFSWRDGFFINIPIAILLILATLKFIGASQKVKAKMDIIGSLLSILGMSALIYGISAENFQVPIIIGAIMVLGIFILVERKISTPLIPLSLFHDKRHSGAYLARFLFTGASFTYWFVTPQLLQTHFGFSPLVTGFAFFPLTIAVFIFSYQTARLTEKYGNTKVLITGLAISIVGYALTVILNTGESYFIGIAIPMIVIGIGQGLTLSPLTSLGVVDTTEGEAGSASGLVNTIHQMGGSVGLALITALASHISGNLATYHFEVILSTIILVIALVVTLVVIYPVDSKSN
ncbi:MFS transporter [Enterococcus sp. AZ103]|uniref:MFS transporter n=1 Tax=Enterococcus sp. AZ103 TaxID=2774628 RepID=UPI003F226F04